MNKELPAMIRFLRPSIVFIAAHAVLIPAMVIFNYA
jgi:hypothetical protein